MIIKRCNVPWPLLALVFLAQCSGQSSLRPHAFSLGEYASGAAPAELRRSVGAALQAERRAANRTPSVLYGRERVSNAAPPCEAEGGPPCPPSKYRSPTGECNNVKHRSWANRGDTFLRLLDPDYSDAISMPRVSMGSHALPSGARVARAIQAAEPPHQHMYVSSLLSAWGGLLLRDLVKTVNPRLDKVRCCMNQTSERSEHMHGECYAAYSEDGACQEYMRTLPGQAVDSCDFKHREQMNLASGFLDGSDLYGATEKEMRAIRLYDGGKVDILACRRCNDKQDSLAPLYRSLLLEHDRIAGGLAQLNSHWEDATLFLEAKRAVTALLQHLTYTEFLTTVLGEVAMSKSELRPLSHGHFQGYSSAHRAGVFSEVAFTALQAFGSMIHPDLINETITLDTLLKTPAQSPSFNFPTSDDQGWDAAALLIHKGRDHGTPSYLKFLNLCEITLDSGDRNITFEDLEKVGIDRSGQKLLKELYMNVEDIDLLAGSALEKPVDGALVGPTTACLLKQQFIKLRNSDRFWYENDLPPSSLSPDQLQSIRRVTLAGLLCSSNSDLDQVQPKAFVIEDPYLNAGQSCTQHPHLELSAWLDQDHMDMGEVSGEMLMSAVERAKQDMVERKKLEYELWEQSGGVDPKSPAGTAASFSKANKKALLLANTSLFFEYATNEIMNTLGQRRRKRQIFDSNLLGFTPDFADALQSVDVTGLLQQQGLGGGIRLEPHCDDLEAPCDASSPFRTLTGHCNNLRNPNLGKSLTTFARLLPPVYEDGVSRPRSTSVTGTPLPSPRIISTVIHPDISNLHNRYTLMVMQYAQIIDHDLTMTPIHKGFHESIPNCRSCDSPRTVHPECHPFPVPRGDHYYPEVNVTSGERLCFPFMRSLPGQQNLGPREQVNQNTAFLDGSMVYGENGCILRGLRGFGGRLNSTTHPVRGKELLPRSDSHPECKSASGYCFIGGDGRASEQPGLTSLHTMFLREHNRLVEGLRGVNPHWDGDRLFAHARRIHIAQIQHVTYNEFLPRLLSWNAVNLYGLKLLPTGYYKEYSPTCNPSIVNEFAAAAYRIGHSLLRPHLPRLSPSYQPIDPPILLRDGFFKVDMFLQPSMTEELIRGLTSTPMETLDQFVTGEVTNHLFEDRRIPFSGIDLIALNIQRARDHGVPSYNNYRALCNLKRAASFEDLSREIPPEVIARLKRIYATVDDIDLFPGGLSERPLQGGLVGPTFACIIAIQFRQLRKCDRFWYENEDPVVRFTEPQLAELRKTTLAKMLCENFDIQSDMQRAAFDLPSNFLNPRVPCHSLPQIDLSAWRESTAQGCQIAGRNVNVGSSAFPSPCTSCICTVEGAQCASLRITDCAQLQREWPRDSILRDDVCSAQCGGLILNNPSQQGSLTEDLIPPPPRQARRNPGVFAGFKVPDLAQFITK